MARPVRSGTLTADAALVFRGHFRSGGRRQPRNSLKAPVRFRAPRKSALAQKREELVRAVSRAAGVRDLRAAFAAVRRRLALHVRPPAVGAGTARPRRNRPWSADLLRRVTQLLDVRRFASGASRSSNLICRLAAPELRAAAWRADRSRPRAAAHAQSLPCRVGRSVCRPENRSDPRGAERTAADKKWHGANASA